MCVEKGAYFEIPWGDTLILSWPQGPDDDREVVRYLSIVTQLTLSVKNIQQWNNIIWQFPFWKKNNTMNINFNAFYGPILSVFKS